MRSNRNESGSYSGLTVTAIAFALIVSAAVIAVGCGDNIGGSSAGNNTRAEDLVKPASDLTLATDTPDADTAPDPAVGEPVRVVTFEEANEAWLDGRFEESADLFEAYTRTNQGNSWGHYMHGIAAWKSGDRETAESAFRRALEIDNGHVKSWVNLSRVLLESDRADEALEGTDKAIALVSESNDAHRTRGRALDELGRSSEAIEAYREALRIDEEDAWSMNNLALVHIRAEEFDQALPPLARAVELRDDVAIFYNNLGITLERLGDLSGATAAFTSAVALDSTYANAAASLARVEAQEPDSLATSFDLGLEAVTFADQIRSWVAGTDSAKVEVEPDTAAAATVDELPID